jgi:hypothetical protein
MNVDAVILRLLEEEASATSKYVNEIANLFREGLSLRELVPLLVHPDPKVAAAGAWIASEVTNERRGRDLLAVLAKHLTHQDPAVRFYALTSVAAIAGGDDWREILAVLDCLVDENSGVRRHALAQVALMPDASFLGSVTQREQPAASLLLEGVSRDQILRALRSASKLEQRLAVLGAIRHWGEDNEFIVEVEGLCDDEVRQKLPSLPRGMAWA